MHCPTLPERLSRLAPDSVVDRDGEAAKRDERNGRGVSDRQERKSQAREGLARDDHGSQEDADERFAHDEPRGEEVAAVLRSRELRLIAPELVVDESCDESAEQDRHVHGQRQVATDSERHGIEAVACLSRLEPPVYHYGADPGHNADPYHIHAEFALPEDRLSDLCEHDTLGALQGVVPRLVSIPRP